MTSGTKRLHRNTAKLTAASTALLAAVFLAIFVGPPNMAHAATTQSLATALYPSGCVTDPHEFPDYAWDNNCWVGASYITNSRYVQAIQVIDGDLGLNDGGRDGLWGPNTAAGVCAFQSYFARPCDEIVGPVTWHAYNEQLDYAFYQADAFYYSVRSDSARFSVGDYYDANGDYGPNGYHCGEVALLLSSGPPLSHIYCV